MLKLIAPSGMASWRVWLRSSEPSVAARPVIVAIASRSTASFSASHRAKAASSVSSAMTMNRT